MNSTKRRRIFYMGCRRYIISYYHHANIILTLSWYIAHHTWIYWFLACTVTLLCLVLISGIDRSRRQTQSSGTLFGNRRQRQRYAEILIIMLLWFTISSLYYLLNYDYWIFFLYLRFEGELDKEELKCLLGKIGIKVIIVLTASHTLFWQSHYLFHVPLHPNEWSHIN